jgi:hypothetical protein
MLLMYMIEKCFRMFMSAISRYLKFAHLTTVYVKPTFSTLKRVLPEKIRRFEIKDMEMIG